MEQHKTTSTLQQHSQHPSEIEYGDGMPDELDSYKSHCRKADFGYNKYDRMSSLRSGGRVRLLSQSR